MKTSHRIISALTALVIFFSVLPFGGAAVAAADGTGALVSGDPERALVNEGTKQIVFLSGQTAADVKALFGGVKVCDAQGFVLASGRTVATGGVVGTADGTAYTVIVPGDTDGDGKVDSADARNELRASAQLEPLSGIYERAADVSGDGRFNAVDARTILRAAAKLDPFTKNTLTAVAFLAPSALGLPTTISGGTNPSGLTFPLRYSDGGISVTVEKRWYVGAWCYIAHIRMTDYARMKTAMARGRYGEKEKIASFVSRNDCLLAVNGDYAEGCGAGVIRNGVVYNDGVSTARALYSQKTGILSAGQDKLFSELARLGYTDSFEFATTELVVNGKSVYLRKDGGKSTQRTLIGATGATGEIYIVVTEGKFSDGVSRGLQYWEAGDLLESLGCTLGIALDGGGSSAMLWNGLVLNSGLDRKREITGFLYVTKD